MANAFQKGDLVVLKSGGPPMVIDKVPGEQQEYGTGKRKEYLCEWFKGATAARGEYAEHVLEKFTRPDATK